MVEQERMLDLSAELKAKVEEALRERGEAENIIELPDNFSLVCSTEQKPEGAMSYGVFQTESGKTFELVSTLG